MDLAPTADFTILHALRLRYMSTMAAALTVLPTSGRLWLDMAKAVAVAARATLGTELGIAHAISAAATIYPNWRRCPVSGPDGEPFVIDLVDGTFGLLTSGFGISQIEPLLGKLSDDAIILDVGANIGAWARLFAHYAPHGKVYAFEPSPANFALLQENARSAPNITCVEAALGCTNGQMAFAESNAESAAQRHLEMLPPEHAACSVAVRRLDDWVVENDISRVDLIKIDVEGFEEDVLEAGNLVLSRARPIVVFEFVPAMAKSRSRFKGEWLFPFFTKHGYRVLRLDQEGGMHKDFASSQEWTSDYVALPE